MILFLPYTQSILFIHHSACSFLFFFLAVFISLLPHQVSFSISKFWSSHKGSALALDQSEGSWSIPYRLLEISS
jgi:hypothetical protein